MGAPRFDAIVFDLDGVIVDTEVSVFDAWCRVFRRYGGELALTDWNRSVGGAHGAQAVYELLCKEVSVEVPPPEELRTEVRALQSALFETMQPMAGVGEWLQEAKELGIPLAVASSSPESWVERCLETVGLRVAFVSVHSPTESLAAKPAPDLYLAACAALRVDPPKALAIEDSHNGVAAAIAAGLVCLAVPNTVTAGADLHAAQLRLGSLAELSLTEATALLISD